MRRSTGCTLLALAALLLPLRTAAAQEGSRHFVCAYLREHDSRTFWVGRQIIEVRSGSQFSSQLDAAVRTQFSTRVHGQISRDDLLAHHPGGYASWGLAQSVIRGSLSEAKHECLGKIEDARREDFSAYGVGSPIYEASSDDESTQSHAFLSILEFPNYQAGTIAARAERGERGGNTASTPRRDAEGWLPGERAEYDRKMRAKGLSILAEADSLYDLTRYADAKEKYRQLTNIGVDAYLEFQAYAMERMAQCDRLAGMQAYSTFNRSTGISFGAYGSQSYFDRDATLFGVSVAKRTFGLKAIYGIAMGNEGFKMVLGDGTDDGSFGEYTRYQLMAGSAIPKLRAGPD